ncbi:unnamed protein product, partial [Owenia fusiformis]
NHRADSPVYKLQEKLKMFIKLITLVVILGVANGFIFAPKYKKRVIPTVPKLDAALYIGRWYQMYTNKQATTFTGQDQHCTSATYQLKDATTITVLNSGKIGSPTGRWSQITGYAEQVNATGDPGKFALHLQYVPFTGSYWIIKLGPVINNQYAYSVVTTNDGGQLYVLARNKDTFKDLYEKEILEFCKEKEFTEDVLKPIPTPQEPTCPYANKKLTTLEEDIITGITG